MLEAMQRIAKARKLMEQLSESGYVGNIGIMELVKFQQKASPEQKKMLKSLIDKDKTKLIYNGILTDVILENEITSTVENVRINDTNYKNIFKEYYITQCRITLKLNTNNDKKINLFKIFNNILVLSKLLYSSYFILQE